MGGSLSILHVERTRESILLALHTLFKDAKEPLSTLTLAAFRRADRNQRGWIASSSIEPVLQELCLAGRWDRIHIDAFASCFLLNDTKSANGGPRTSSRVDYLAFLDVLFFPIQVSRDSVQLTITQHAVVSAGGWRVHEGDYGGRPVTIKELELRESLDSNDATKQSLFVVQQPHASCTLKTILQSFGPMKEASIRRYLVQMVHALSFLHSHDIIHGNLHLESIHIDSSGLLKLSDYGASIEYSELLALISAEQNDWLHQFPPPEYTGSRNTAAQRSSKAADVWAVGVLMWQMAYGVGTEAELALQNSSARSFASHPPIPKSMSKDLRAIVQACLQPRARARPLMDEVAGHEFFHADSAQAQRKILSNVEPDRTDRPRTSRSEPSATSRKPSATPPGPQIRPMRPRSSSRQR